MAGSALDTSDGGKGSQSDNLKFAFGRGSDKGRTSVAFAISSNGQKAVPKQWRYDYTLEAWEDKTPTSVVSFLPNLTRKALRLDNGNFDTQARGTKSASKDWKVKVLSAQSTVKRDLFNGKPTGRPAKYTCYSINVPFWVSAYVFAQSVHAALRAQVNLWDGKDQPNVGDIVSYITPYGRTLSIPQIEALFKASAPKKKESAKYDVLT
jgi:hypothetical protein